MGKTKIEWATDSWNPVTGCTKVSEGCRNCYAERMTERFHGKGSFEKVICHPDRLAIPLHWKKPRRIFVNSMSDLFHEEVPEEFIDQVWAVMAVSTQHSFQVLTKRPERMRRYCANPLAPFRVAKSVEWPLDNIWLGTSVEDQATADERIPILLQTKAAVRWISAEPLLGPIDLREVSTANVSAAAGNKLSDCLHWVIVGGESGPNARPMDIQWVRNIRDQCKAAKIPCFVKQDSGRVPGKQGRLSDADWSVKEYPNAIR